MDEQVRTVCNEWRAEDIIKRGNWRRIVKEMGEDPEKWDTTLYKEREPLYLGALLRGGDSS